MLQILFLSSLISCNRDSIDGGYNIQELHSTIVSTANEVNFGNVVVLYDDTKSFQIINAGKADLEIQAWHSISMKMRVIRLQQPPLSLKM